MCKIQIKRNLIFIKKLTKKLLTPKQIYNLHKKFRKL